MTQRGLPVGFGDCGGDQSGFPSFWPSPERRVLAGVFLGAFEHVVGILEVGCLEDVATAGRAELHQFGHHAGAGQAAAGGALLPGMTLKRMKGSASRWSVCVIGWPLSLMNSSERCHGIRDGFGRRAHHRERGRW